jgi:predicted RNase H-like HicB family nuclease
VNHPGTKRYAVVIERTGTGYGAYVPDLPGCVVAAAETLEETERLIREAIPFHIEGLPLHGEPVPEPAVRVEFVEAETTV